MGSVLRAGEGGGMIKLLTGWRGYLAVATLTGAAASGGAWMAQQWRYEARIAVIQRGQAESRADAAHAALNRLAADINVVAAAGRRAAAVGPALTAEI